MAEVPSLPAASGLVIGQVSAAGMPAGEDAAQKPKKKKKKNKLPRNVVRVASTRLGERYGVKVKVFGKQVRLGSRFSDVESAVCMAQTFRKVIHKDHWRRTVTFDEAAARSGGLDQLRARLFQNRSSLMEEVVVVDFIREWVRERCNPETGEFGRRARGWPPRGTAQCAGVAPEKRRRLEAEPPPEPPATCLLAPSARQTTAAAPAASPAAHASRADAAASAGPAPHVDESIGDWHLFREALKQVTTPQAAAGAGRPQQAAGSQDRHPAFFCSELDGLDGVGGLGELGDEASLHYSEEACLGLDDLVLQPAGPSSLVDATPTQQELRRDRGRGGGAEAARHEGDSSGHGGDDDDFREQVGRTLAADGSSSAAAAVGLPERADVLHPANWAQNVLSEAACVLARSAVRTQKDAALHAAIDNGVVPWPSSFFSGNSPFSFFYRRSISLMHSFAGREFCPRDPPAMSEDARRAQLSFIQEQIAVIEAEHGTGATIALSPFGMLYETWAVASLMGMTLRDKWSKNETKRAFSIMDIPRIMFAASCLWLQNTVSMDRIWIYPFNGEDPYEASMVLKRYTGADNHGVTLLWHFVPRLGVDGAIAARSQRLAPCGFQ